MTATDAYRMGGLMRCCIASLVRHPTPGAEGDVIPCEYCPSTIRFRDGAWEWNHA